MNVSRADEIRYLPAFLAVCEEGGFGRAAAKLNLSQPAVSYQVRALERLVGAPLFSRSGRGVTLTPRGELLRDFCRRTFEDLGAVRAEMAGGEAARGRPLRIASVSAFGRYVLFPVLCAETPLPGFTLRFPTQEEVLEAVRAGVADVGFIYEERVSSALHLTPVAVEELVLVRRRVPRARPLATLEDGASQPFVTWDEHEYVFGQWFERAFRRPPRELRSVAHLEEMEEVLELVRRGAGLSVVPLDCARALVEARALEVVRPPRARPGWNPIHAVERPHRRSEAAARLIARVKEAAAARSR
jgi:DNA-binding transcriptional LysR family regulator